MAPSFAEDSARYPPAQGRWGPTKSGGMSCVLNLCLLCYCWGMTMRLRRVAGSGPVPPGLEIIRLSCCEQCLFWERTQYIVTGNCRRYPYPRMYAWQLCAHWTNRHGRQSFLNALPAGPGA